MRYDKFLIYEQLKLNISTYHIDNNIIKIIFNWKLQFPQYQVL